MELVWLLTYLRVVSSNPREFSFDLLSSFSNI